MNSDLEALFEAARGLKNPSQRQAFLDAACCGDPESRRELEELLELESDAKALLDDGAASLEPHAAELRQLPLALLATAPVKEQAGEWVGRYKLLQKLGEGGCGVVYMAQQEAPVRRKVALKIVKLGMDTKQVIARFEAERQALALMDHPNIAKVLDAGATDTGRPYFVMELVRGTRITQYCDQERLNPRQRLELFAHVCHAVQHAHQKGIIHRDIKPSNILVTECDGVPVPKVIDFGIAKATGDLQLTDKTLFTAFEQFMGTPAYMSPEQARLGELDIDTRTDIYSLGVLLYELLTGKTPFDTKALLAAGLQEMRRSIQEKEPAKPSTRLTSLDAGELASAAANRQVDGLKLVQLMRGDLDWIVMRALEKDRARRYETPNGLAADVQHHLKSEPVSARPPTASYKILRFLRRHRVAVAATGSFVMLVLAGLALALVLLSREARAHRLTALEAKKSKEVTQFLEDMFGSSYSQEYQTLDKTLLVALADHAAARLENLHDEPEVQAELYHALGRVYRATMDFVKAQPMFEASLRLRSGLFGTNSLLAAECMDELASSIDTAVATGQETRLNTSALVKAEKLELAAIDVRSRLAGKESFEVGQCLVSLGSIRKQTGDINGSRSAYEQAFDIFQKLPGTEAKFQTFRAASEAAFYQDTLGNVSQAEKWWRRALEIAKAGSEPVEVELSEIQLAKDLKKQTNFLAAEAALQEGIDTLGRWKAPGRASANLWTRLGDLRAEQTHWASAAGAYQRALDLSSNVWGLSTARLLFKKYQAEKSQAHYLDAEMSLNEAADILQGYLHAEPEFVRELAQNFVSLYTLWNKPEEAAKWSKKAQELSGASPGERKKL